MSTYCLWMVQKCCICIIFCAFIVSLCALYNLSLVTLEVNNTRQQYSGCKLYNNIMYSKFFLLISFFVYLQITCSMQYHNFTKYLAFSVQESFCHCLRSILFQCYMCYILHAYYFMVALYCRMRAYIFSSCLWSPCVIGQTIIFLTCDFYLVLFFPRLISAAADWMSTILLHTAWP